MYPKTAIVPLKGRHAQQPRQVRAGVQRFYNSAAGISYGALPARFRRERILIIGCGDVAMRLVKQTSPATKAAGHEGAGSTARVWRALTSSPAQIAKLRALGICPLVGNLDQPASLKRLAGLATRIVHLAPPAAEGLTDTRTRALLRSLRQSPQQPASLVYISTSGVYGDCQGAWVRESRPVAPVNARAVRRVDAEQQVRALALQGVAGSVLRAPGIYAFDRSNGSPLGRLQKGTPVLACEDDVYTNHIHADDLARACWLALWRSQPGRVFNANDDSAMRMGDYFDAVACALHYPAPPRISRAQAEQTFSAMQLSFLSESRRLCNRRIKRELRMAWHYPSIHAAVAAYLGQQP